MLLRARAVATRPILTALAAHSRLLNTSSAWRGSRGGSWQYNAAWKALTASAMAGAAGISTAICEGKEEALKEEKEQGDAFIDAMAPLASQVTAGTVMGYTSGYALRVVGKVAAVFVGAIFMSFQTAAYMGYVDVNWKKAQGDISQLLDVDGDGQVDTNDAKILFSKFIEVCTYNLPSGAGFTGGLLLGLGFGGSTAGKAAAAVGTATLIPRALAIGAGATGLSGVGVVLKEKYDAATSATKSVLNSIGSKTQTEEEIFAAALQSQDLSGLRELEAAAKKCRAKAEKDEVSKFDRRLTLIEERKKQIKRA